MGLGATFLSGQPRAALRVGLRGVVQGVGARPGVFRLAQEHGLTGWVRNDDQGLTIHVEGGPSGLDAFLVALRQGPAPAARVDSLQVIAVPVEDFDQFEVRPSQRAGAPDTLISPDLPFCAACLAEMNDPASRRYRYPYINCAHCGPRYSVVRSLPYDRAQTTMADWPLCPACRTEYEDPTDRRHHAQPTACPDCGPNYVLVRDGQTLARGVEALALAAKALREGTILALKGIGGYHLACDAGDSAAIGRLRSRKFRKERPFAVMARDLTSAEEIARLDERLRALLLDQARPIVLAPARVRFPGLADETDEIGVMLPYAPLHTLLFDLGAPDPLVLTSANRSSEPIAYRDDDALERLTGLADAFLIGERPIARRVDDSVATVMGGETSIVRRARGLAPAKVALLPSARPILALGADLKNAVTLVVSGQAIGSQHIGDLGDMETDRALEETVRDLLSMYAIDPRELIVAHDAHPQFVSTRLAARIDSVQRVAVQHHRAHVASVLAEHDELDRPVVGIALDGTGHGDDGSIWGFEVFGGSVVKGLRRLAHLRPAILPGGDGAARFPVQAAAGFLTGLELPDLSGPPFHFPKRYDQARTLVAHNVRCFPTTSAGRLFDTAAALCGFTREVTYEGQAAIWLERLAQQARDREPYPFPDLDHRPLLQALIADRRAGRDVHEVAYAFHAAIARSLALIAVAVARHVGTRHVALSGGVFQNRLLRTMLEDREGEASGLTFLFHRSVPTNDGGISLGQAAWAAVRP